MARRFRAATSEVSWLCAEPAQAIPLPSIRAANVGYGYDPLSSLEQRCKDLVEFFDRHCARMLFAVYEECWCRIDLELLRAPISHLLDLGEQRLVVDARLETLLREAGLLGDGEQRRNRFAHCPFLLLR